MKKIAILLNDLGLGGAERCAVTVASGLAKRGDRVSLVLLRRTHCFWGPMPAGVDVVSVSEHFVNKRFVRWWQALKTIARQHDVLIAGNILFPTYVLYGLSRYSRGQQIAWVHGPIADIDAYTPLNWFHQTIGRAIYRRLPQVVFVSTHAKMAMDRWLGHSPRADWRVIYNSVPPLGAPPMPRRAQHPLKLLFVGRLSAEKAPLTLLEVVAQLKDNGIPSHLTIVGDGELRTALQATISQQGLDEHVAWVGSQADTQPYLLAADVLLLTSRFEGCPLVILEAMQQALPVVTTRAGGIPELLGAALTEQLTVESVESRLFKDKIIDVAANYAAISAAMLSRSHQFTEENMLDQWCQLIQ